ncbi:SBBP repeat-containing protein [Bythopirellula goksoeyrii]|nr:SBBP repeat-containing protein [Bythopirellula goksoeyrii]
MSTRAILTLFIVSLGVTAVAQTESLDWIEQYGTTASDGGLGVSADGLGSVYVAGFTNGSLVTTSTSRDAFVSRFDDQGNELWTTQFGSTDSDFAYAASADGLGNVYVSGLTDGDLATSNAGSADAFVSKFDSSGSLLWSRQFGTSASDVSYGVYADGLGYVYATGITGGDLNGTNSGKFDAFLRKYDAAGNLLWTRQYGSSESDYAYGVSADALGNVYVSGDTFGDLGGINAGDTDAYVIMYDAAGNLQWTRQLGTTEADLGHGVSADGAGNVFLAGSTQGDLARTNAGSFGDGFVSKFDINGTELWTEQFGTSASEAVFSASADALGNVYVGGNTAGSLAAPNAGSIDTFVSKFDSTGTHIWSGQVGSSSYDSFYALSADGLGNVYLSGQTPGILGNASYGSQDIYLLKFKYVPEPSSLLLTVLTCGGMLARVRSTT